MKETILLHSCCAPCSAAIVEWLLAHEIEPVIYYFNPNIYPAAEYEKRKGELTRFAEGLSLRVIDGDWDHEGWLRAVRGLENEPERGARCAVCFSVRLTKAAQMTHELRLSRFTTSLASSRWKSLEQVNAAGFAAAARFPGITYWDKNWRKDGLQERRNALIRDLNFYNQPWCGCEFSFAAMQSKLAARAAALASTVPPIQDTAK